MYSNNKEKLMHSPVMRIVNMATWLLTSIGAINWGLEALGYNIFDFNFVQTNLMMLVNPFKIVVGIAGVLTLVHFGMHCSAKHCSC